VSTRHEIVQRFDDSPAAKQPLETLVRSLRETLELLAPEATPETLRDAECTIRLRRLKFVPVHKFMKLAASNSVPKEDLTRLKEAGLIRIWETPIGYRASWWDPERRLKEGRKAAEEGMTLTLDADDEDEEREDWKDAFVEFIYEGLQIDEEFTAEDVRAAIDDPPSPPMMGAMFGRVSRARIISDTHQRPHAERKSSHAHEIRVWRRRDHHYRLKDVA